MVFIACVSNKSSSDFIWDFGKIPFPTHLGKYFIKIGKIRAKIHEIGKIKAIFGLGMTPIYGLKNGQIKSLSSDESAHLSSLTRAFTTAIQNIGAFRRHGHAIDGVFSFACVSNRKAQTSLRI